VLPYPHLPSRRVGEKLDVLHALTEFIEDRHSAVEQRTAVLRRLYPAPMAIKQAHTKRMFQFRDRSRNGGLSAVEALRRLPHAAGFHHSDKDVQVVQFHPASGAIAQLHGGYHVEIGMTSSGTNIIRNGYAQLSSREGAGQLSRPFRSEIRARRVSP
jgi:hypothetical protein